MSARRRAGTPSAVTAAVPADRPASAMAATLILDSRAIANAFVQSCFVQAARLDDVSPTHWGYLPERGVWRHRSATDAQPHA